MNERLIYEFLRQEGYEDYEIEDREWDLAEKANDNRRDYELESNYEQHD